MRAERPCQNSLRVTQLHGPRATAGGCAGRDHSPQKLHTLCTREVVPCSWVVKEQDVRQRIESFLKRTVREMIVPAPMGLGLALSGCMGSQGGTEGLVPIRQSSLSLQRRRTGHVRTQIWATLALSLAAASTTACRNPLGVPGARDSGVTDDSRSESKDALPSLDLSVPPDSGGFAGVRDTGLAQDSRRETWDALVTVDLPARPDSGQASDATPAAQCANQVLDSRLVPVRGTVRGPRVEAEVCGNGLGTSFLGPEDYLVTPYNQDFFTTSVYGGAVPPGSYGPGFYGFLLRAPADALSADLSGSTGASAPEVGTYDSATSCGSLDFDVTLPVPPGVVCTTPYGPCDPGCKGSGEMAICEPAPAMMYYRAASAAACGSNQYPPQGDWQLTIASVSPLAVPDGYQHFQTHGHLTATLVNQDDPSDSVVLNLDF